MTSVVLPVLSTLGDQAVICLVLVEAKDLDPLHLACKERAVCSLKCFLVEPACQTMVYHMPYRWHWGVGAGTGADAELTFQWVCDARW